MSKCNICPRKCNVDRLNGKKGVCNVSGNDIFVARASLHMWEEPCISGEKGSGTIFFSGCNLKCVYCQNHDISRGISGKGITVERLSEICIELQKKGANNINLVTPTHYALHIMEAVKMAKEKGLKIPVVYNSSGYESKETLELLRNIIDIYLVDFKYINKETAIRYSKAEDYPDVVKAAVETMYMNVGEPVFDEYGIMKKGVIVRHLLLPSHVKEAKQIVTYLYKKYGNRLYLSLMNQYTPAGSLISYPEINRKVTKKEYERLIDYAIELGIQNCFIQEGETALESFIPAFDGEGV